ncbi:hypothetical protein EV138_5727 [Kribbella voronezhensis]|uniref:Uncharacterized protein n=1 Tax=Kribbella voronezhensis TaxID=2512212 RepID=A0A4R7SWG3_9ACTN|nr:hypothetical protein EV138_5727 [Kribbella voronezhensis]
MKSQTALKVAAASAVDAARLTGIREIPETVEMSP